jgi:tRNA nucleotidyltransferase (CCA-adding enzyme)
LTRLGREFNLNKMKIKLPKDLKEFAAHFKKKGFQCFLVGGAIRNILLKQKVKDFDIATDAPPAKMQKLFKKVIPTGIQHGTVTVLYKTHQFEVTTFRTDGEYKDYRRPIKIEFAPSIYDDLKRRDFTINALAYDLHKTTLLDPYNGRIDLKNKIIRAIGNPEERFQEDALRTLRACRFACVLNFVIEDTTLEGISKTAPLINHISKERIRDELLKILETPIPSHGLELLRNTNLLPHILPELMACLNVKQPDMHCFDVYYHSLYSCDAAPASNLIVRLAALFHDLGKPDSITSNEKGELRFFGHEKKSQTLARQILKRLKFPNSVIKAACHLILHHMFNYDESWTDAAVRRFIHRVGLEYIDDLIALRKADQTGICNRPVSLEYLMDFKERIEDISKAEAVFSVNNLCIDGNDIMKQLSIPEGFYVGKILNYLLECVLDDPALNTRESLLRIAKEFYQQRLKPSNSHFSK